MLMDHDPLIANLAQADGEVEVQLDVLSTCLPPGTTHQGSYKRHIVAGGNVHLVNAVDNGVVRPRSDISYLLAGPERGQTGLTSSIRHRGPPR
jgi:hypothetical protein